jgi:thioredoxin-related protein
MKAMLKIAIILVLVCLHIDAAAEPSAPVLQAVTAAKAVPAKEVNLSPLSDWAVVASAAQKAQVPIIVMVSLEGCGFCKVVRQSHLLPMLAHEITRENTQEKSPPRAIVRQIEINGSHTLIDASGAIMSHAKFAKNLGAKVAPTVYFLNAKGEQIAPPLEGGLLPDFYSAYLDDALAIATNKIRGASALK